MQPKTVVGICCFCVVLITSIILFAVSWATLEPVEVGLDVNGNTMTLNKQESFTAGRYLLGLGHWFVKFNTSLQTIRFSGENVTSEEADDKEFVALSGPINARTRDGLPVELKISFQYTLSKKVEDLVALYEDFGSDFEKAYMRMSRDVIRDVASRFTAFEFFKNRTAINTEMLSVVNQALNGQHANVQTFQVLNIALPKEFDAAIQQTEVTRQERLQAENQRDTARIQSETRVLQAGQDALIVLVKANATAMATDQQSGMKADINAEEQAFRVIRDNLSLNTTELLGFAWLRAVSESKASLVLAVEKPASLKSP